MPTQTEAGKAFEFALLTQFFHHLNGVCRIRINKDESYQNAIKCFELFSSSSQNKYLKAAEAAVHHILELEPRLADPINENDTLELEIAPDSAGIKGDVRDILFIRSSQNWEIGISAKNNHKAVKHSRLSASINFGREWLNISCSQNYFSKVKPIFNELKDLRSAGQLWCNLENKQSRFYVPILNAFKEELLFLDHVYPTIVPENLLKYLLGNKDFYKVIKRPKVTEIYGFQLQGTLNKSAVNKKPRFSVTRVKLPSRIIELAFKANSGDTLLLTFDQGWQISFRIHNASKSVEPSLKFDINIIGQPQTLYSHHSYWD